MILMAYLSYMLAEVSFSNTYGAPIVTFFFSYNKKDSNNLTRINILFILQLFYLSAILTVFFCGIVMSHYTWHNVTESSRVTTKYV